jgi:triosephosphate isomerase
MNRPVWILGNWKQNHLREKSGACARALSESLGGVLHGKPGVRVGVAPTYAALDVVRPYASPNGLALLAQDVAAQESGAFTGEVGPAMLLDAGVELAIIGHSERRALFGEGDTVVAAKVKAACAAGLGVVLCVGEPLEVRDAGRHEAHTVAQLEAALAQIDLPNLKSVLTIAYEPVWAIGTGRTASPEQAAAMHRCLRSFLSTKYGDAGRDRSILYGGSVKPDNAGELIAAGDVDGFLVGGASLDPASFLAIVRAAVERMS